MTWATRERPKIDRIACLGLIARFVDKDLPKGALALLLTQAGVMPLRQQIFKEGNS